MLQLPLSIREGILYLLTYHSCSILQITVPFQYEWLDEMFREMSTYVFFVLTGYKFRAAAANPYFTLTNDETTHADEDDEMDVV